MNKLLIEVHCSATAKTYEFWIPKKMTVEVAMEKIAEDIQAFELNNELFDLKGKNMLYCYEQRTFLDREHTLEQAGVVSGNRLMIL